MSYLKATATDAPAPPYRQDPAPRSWRAVAATVIPPLLVALVALLNVGLHVRAYTLVSPIDELQHIDYLYKSPAIVAPGDRVGNDAMREEACRGIDFPWSALPACVDGAVYDPESFQERGYNTAAVNTPLYYGVTHAMALPIMWLSPVDNLVEAGRLAGGLWLAGGLLLAYAAARRLGAARWPTAAVLVVVACVPAVVYPSATITPDAATFAVGAGTLLVALWWEERPPRRWPLLAVVVAAALAMKLTNLTVVGTVGLYLLFRLAIQWWGSRRGPADLTTDAAPVPRLRDWLVGGVTVAATSALVAGGWTVAQAAMTRGDLEAIPMNQMFHVEALSLGPTVQFFGSWLTPLSNPWVVVGDPDFTGALQQLGLVLVTGGIVAAILIGRRALRERALAWATGLTGLLGASLFILLSFYLQSLYVPPPARYGYALVPAMTVLTATGISTRPAAVAVGTVAAAATALSVLRLAF